MLDKEAYYNAIVDTIINIGRAEEFIVALSELIQRLVIDHLHILGDIYDRGPGPDRIMDKLYELSLAGHPVGKSRCPVDGRRCRASRRVLPLSSETVRDTVIWTSWRTDTALICCRWLRLALEVYKDDPCTLFEIKGDGQLQSKAEDELNMKMHKAITIIQFKLEGQLIARRKSFRYGREADLLDRIDYEKGTILSGRRDISACWIPIFPPLTRRIPMS